MYNRPGRKIPIHVGASRADPDNQVLMGDACDE
jgi:hypothetical protein